MASFMIANTSGIGANEQAADPDRFEAVADRGDDSQPANGAASDTIGTKSLHKLAMRWRDKAAATTPSRQSTLSSPIDRPLSKSRLRELVETIYAEQRPANRPAYQDSMVRERVDVRGVVRDLEAPEELAALQLSPAQVGVIKEGPIKRFLEGMRLADRRYAKLHERIRQERVEHVRSAETQESKRLRAALQRLGSTRRHELEQLDEGDAGEDDLEDLLRLRGPWALSERPPPSSVVGRKDTAEALRLARVIDESEQNRSGLRLWTRLVEGLDSHHSDD